MEENTTINSQEMEAIRAEMAARGAVIKGVLKAMGISLRNFAMEMEMQQSFLSKVLRAVPDVSPEVIEVYLDRAEGLLRQKKVSILIGPGEVGIFIPKSELSLKEDEAVEDICEVN